MRRRRCSNRSCRVIPARSDEDSGTGTANPHFGLNSHHGEDAVIEQIFELFPVKPLAVVASSPQVELPKRGLLDHCGPVVH